MEVDGSVHFRNNVSYEVSSAKNVIVRSKLKGPCVPFIPSILFTINWPNSGLPVKRGDKSHLQNSESVCPSLRRYNLVALAVMTLLFRRYSLLPSPKENWICTVPSGMYVFQYSAHAIDVAMLARYLL